MRYSSCLGLIQWENSIEYSFLIKNHIKVLLQLSLSKPVPHLSKMKVLQIQSPSSTFHVHQYKCMYTFLWAQKAVSSSHCFAFS